MQADKSSESQKEEVTTPSPTISNASPSANSSGDSEWKSSAVRMKRSMRVGQGLGKKLKLIKVPSPP